MSGQWMIEPNTNIRHMSKVSFNKPGAVIDVPAEVKPAPQQEATPAPNTATATAVVGSSQALTTTTPPPPVTFYDDDNVDASDLVLPRLNFAQNVGEIGENFPKGAIVLDGQLQLVDPPQGKQPSAAIKLLVAGFQPTLYAEKVVGGARGNIFRTEEEVVNNGGTLDYSEAKTTGKTLYQRLCTALVVIEKPEKVGPELFPNEFDGKNYAIALYSMKGTSYTNAAKHFKTARKLGHLVHGYRTGWWTMASVFKKFEGTNSAYAPLVRPAGPSTPEFQAWLREKLGF